MTASLYAAPRPRSTATTVFVGGPIQYAVKSDGSFHAGTRGAIERVIASLADAGHEVLSAHVYENFGEMDVSGMFQQVCLRDHLWMRQCDVFVAVLPLDQDGNVIHSAGTSVELGWASALGKPIVLVCDTEPKYSHLVIGLDAVARVIKVDIDHEDLGDAVSRAVIGLLGDAYFEGAEREAAVRRAA